MEKIKSHMCIPKSLLNNFTYDGKHVYVYNINKNNIYVSSTEDVCVKNGYYSQKIEEKLSNYEAAFKNICKKVIARILSDTIDEVMNYLSNHKKIVLDFANVTLLRSNFVFDYFKNDVKEFLDKNNVDLSSTSEIINFCLNNNFNLINRIGDVTSIIKIDSKKSFITNSLGFHFIVDKSKCIKMLIPISTNIGIIISKEIVYYSLTDSALDLLNKNAIVFDKEFGYGFIISKDKIDLENSISCFNEL